jgi:preprotein translocase subunit YajC
MTINLANALLAMGQQPGQQPGGGAPWYVQFFPLFLMVFVFYFVFIRPQQRKAKEHDTMMKAIRSGDKIVTSSGIVGIVVSVKEKTVAIRSADTKLEVLKSAVTEITERAGEPSPANP